MIIFCPYCNSSLDNKQMRKQKCNSCLHEWDIYHIVPINDDKEHDLLYSCHCKPKVRNEGDNMLIVHNSYDGREGVEWANEILQNTQ